jgi:GTPase SAR1 family protein
VNKGTQQQPWGFTLRIRMNTYSVIMLGPSGSGKTVFLASLYKKLSTQGDTGFFLQVESAEKRKRLNNLYTQIAVDEKWPKGTTYSEVSEWTFTCRVQTEGLPIYSACQFTYLDYAGGRINDEMGEEDPEFDNQLKNADALLGLLDGQRLLALMQGEAFGRVWAVNDLPNMLNIMQEIQNKPIHFVISKWDIIEGRYTLEEIIDRLYKIDEFRNLIRTRSRGNIPIRLIPISAVGKDFATLQKDGSMSKNSQTLPKPFQVEVPLACVLPDMIQTKLKEIMQQRKEIYDTPIDVQANVSFWDWLGELVGEAVSTVSHLLPKKYQFAADILERLIEFLDTPIEQKREVANNRMSQLQREKEEALKKVTDEETALNYIINCFLNIQNRLDYNFPESNLKQ